MEVKIKLLLFASLLSLVASLVAIVYLSLEMLSDVSGLKTSSEKFAHLSNLLRELEGRGSSEQMGLSAGDTEFCIQALEDEKPDVRMVAAQLLGRLGDEQAADALLRKLADKNYRVREAAVEALGRVGGEKTVEELVEKLELKILTSGCILSGRLPGLEMKGQLTLLPEGWTIKSSKSGSLQPKLSETWKAGMR